MYKDCLYLTRRSADIDLGGVRVSAQGEKGILAHLNAEVSPTYMKTGRTYKVFPNGSDLLFTLVFNKSRIKRMKRMPV